MTVHFHLKKTCVLHEMTESLYIALSVHQIVLFCVAVIAWGGAGLAPPCMHPLHGYALQREHGTRTVAHLNAKVAGWLIRLAKLVCQFEIVIVVGTFALVNKCSTRTVREFFCKREKDEPKLPCSCIEKGLLKSTHTLSHSLTHSNTNGAASIRFPTVPSVSTVNHCNKEIANNFGQLVVD